MVIHLPLDDSERPRDRIATVCDYGYQASKRLTVYRLRNSRATILAQGSVASCPGAIESVASDGRRVVVTCQSNLKRFVYVGVIAKGRVGAFRPSLGPAQVGTTVSGGGGIFYAANLVGDLSRALPSFWEARGASGSVSNDRAELRITDDLRHLLLVVTDANGTTACSTFTVAHIVDGKPYALASKPSSEYNEPWTDAVYLPKAREVWTLDGKPRLSYWRVPAMGVHPRPTGTISLDADALRIVRLGPSRWLVAGGDGALSIGEVVGHRWRRLDRAKVFPKGGVDVGLWASADHRTAYVCFTLTGELWSVPLHGGLAKAKPTRIARVGTPCLISVDQAF